MSQTPEPAGCPSCGEPLEAGARFCSACGADVSPPAVCVACGAPVPPGTRFCPSCGSPQAAIPGAAASGAWQAAQPAAAGPVPCPGCGAEIRPPARFCRRCGTSATGEPPPRRGGGLGGGATVGIAAAAAVIVGGAFLLLRGGGDQGGQPGAALPSASPTSPGAGDVLVADSAQARADLEALVARTGEKAFRAEYDVVLEEQTSGISINATVTLAVDEPRFGVVIDAGREGFDLASLGGEEEGVTPEPSEPLEILAIISDGERAWACQKLVGEPGECQEQAVESEEDQMDFSGLLDEILASGSEDELFGGKEVKGRRIAGREARCYVIDRTEEGDVASDAAFTVCVDRDEGLPLLVEGTLTASGDLSGAVSEASTDSVASGIEIEQDSVDARWVVRATSVQFRVSDSDFRPLYPVSAE